MSAIPDENPTELMRIYAPFAEYLQREIGIPVQFTPVVDYAATVEGMAANKLDLVWFGGLTHVQARIRTNNTAYAIAMREEDLKFKSVFITNPQANIKSLQELKGQNLRLRQCGLDLGPYDAALFSSQSRHRPRARLQQVQLIAAPTMPRHSGSSRGGWTLEH